MKSVTWKTCALSFLHAGKCAIGKFLRSAGAATSLQQLIAKMTSPLGSSNRGTAWLRVRHGTTPMSQTLTAAFPRRTVLFIVVGVAALAVVIGLFAFRSHQVSTTTDATGAVIPEPSTSSGASPEIEILLGLARDATKEGRLVAPQGNNAYEYYLSVSQLDPKNTTAQDALRETLPFASQEIESQINRRELEEARREIALLRDYDPTNYTLIILGAKLDAQQQVVTAEDEAKADAIRRRNG
jgi:periplasmic protein TonB